MVIKKEQKEEVQTAASMLNVSSCVVYNNSWYLCAYIPGIYVVFMLKTRVKQHVQSMSNVPCIGPMLAAFD